MVCHWYSLFETPPTAIFLDDTNDIGSSSPLIGFKASLSKLSFESSCSISASTNALVVLLYSLDSSCYWIPWSAIIMSSLVAWQTFEICLTFNVISTTSPGVKNTGVCKFIPNYFSLDWKSFFSSTGWMLSELMIYRRSDLVRIAHIFGSICSIYFTSIGSKCLSTSVRSGRSP